MPVVRETPVGVLHLAALGDRQEIVVAARGTHIEEISAAAGFHGFGKNLVSIFFRIPAGWLVRGHGAVGLGYFRLNEYKQNKRAIQKNPLLIFRRQQGFPLVLPIGEYLHGAAVGLGLRK